MLVLRIEFPFVPSPFLRQLLSEKERLYSTYLTLAAFENHYSELTRPYERLSKPRNIPTPGQQSLRLMGELNAAKKKAQKDCGIL